jgi:1-acyl-sn-glycerol-3-phosphate acyltransferase
LKEKLTFTLRLTLTMVLMTIGALVMLVVAVLTGFQLRRFYSETIAMRLGRITLRLWGIRMVVHQQQPFPAGQTIYISNHTSTIDVFVLIALGLPNARFFLSGFLRKLLPLGLIGYLIGIIWTVDQIYPDKRRRIFQRAEQLLRRTGESVYLSPEGERITTGQIGHFNKGAFHLATALKVPIIPLFIRIPLEINPGMGLNARPGTVDVFIRPPIDTSHWRIEDLMGNKEKVRDMYVEWHRALRTA